MPTIKIPDDIKANIENIAETKKVPLDQLKKELMELYDSDEIAVSMPNEMARLRSAFGTLLSKYFKSGGGGQTIVIRVVCKFPQRTVGVKQSKISDVIGMVMEMDDQGNVIPEVDYSCIACWGDSSLAPQSVVKGKIYQVKVAKDKKQPDWGKTFSAYDKGTSFEEVEIEGMPTIEQFYKDSIDTLDIDVALSEIDMHESKFNTDLRRVKGTIADARKGNDKKTGAPYYTYDVWDRNPNQTFTIWTTEEQFIGGVGSVLRWTGIVGKAGGSMNAHFTDTTGPGSLVPLKLRPKPVAKEEQAVAQEPERNEEAEEAETDKSIKSF